jgi:hypothetical protein
LAIYRPNPGDDFPEVIIGFDGLAEGGHRPDDCLGAFAGVTLPFERFAGAKCNQPEQRIVSVAIDPNWIGKRRCHASAATTSMAAVAVERHVYLMTFLGDAGEVPVRAFELTFRRAGYAFQGRHGFPGRDVTAWRESGNDQAHENSDHCPMHCALAF